MPFDGIYFETQATIDTGLFPVSSRQGFRRRIGFRLSPERRDSRAQISLYNPPSNREAAIIGLLENAKALIEDPKIGCRAATRRFPIGVERSERFAPPPDAS